MRYIGYLLLLALIAFGIWQGNKETKGTDHGGAAGYFLAGRGLTNKAIASQLSISDRTVQNHLANIFGKLNATSRTEAVMRGVSLGLIPANLADTPLD